MVKDLIADPMTLFAVEELRSAVDESDRNLRIELRLASADDSLSDEGFRLSLIHI